MKNGKFVPKIKVKSPEYSNTSFKVNAVEEFLCFNDKSLSCPMKTFALLPTLITKIIALQNEQICFPTTNNSLLSCSYCHNIIIFFEAVNEIASTTNLDKRSIGGCIVDFNADHI
uniref:Uncharacterized protein n=1 Tax=Romanomermis culicivorax TaxID=13658 RepID=A0A915IHU8_ROMCU